MKKLAIGIIAVIVVGALAYAFCPAIRGPFNRARNAANDTLEEEYVVDNYRATVKKLVAKRKEVAANIAKFTAEIRISEKKLENAKGREEFAKKVLLDMGTSDLAKFNRARSTYEVSKTEVGNLKTLIGVYENALRKLTSTRDVIDENIRKCDVNIATLKSKKAVAESLKAVNDTIDNLHGTGDDHDLGVNLEKLDDTILEQSIRIETLTEKDEVGSVDEAQSYLESLRQGGN